ncbi:MAG TPA: hypothetical protein VHA78_05230 [Candidatus Peribacteraceae bacterium]|nr:hypothetical protein [Candidatus Peribacteraceae bacterium]
MRVLLDTNVIIQSEDDVELSEHVQELHQLAQKHGIQLCVHQQNRADLMNDRDERRRRITIGKLGKYPQLEFNQQPTPEFFAEIGAVSTPGTNDFIDDCLLFALKSHATSYLISEDNGIHAKARRIAGMEDRVFFIEEFIEMVREQFEQVTPMLPTIEEVEINTLNVDDPIFDSLKEDYDGFTDWFHRKAEEGRRAWVMRQGTALAAVCIFDPRNRDCDDGMKLCTFKASDLLKGLRAGEHLLKQAFFFATEHGITMMRVEVFSDKEYLIGWFEDFGFYQIASKMKNGRTELVFQKDMTPITTNDGAPLALARKHFPFLPEPPFVRAFVIPIQPEFSSMLFPELAVQGSLWLSPCGHAITKVYVCNANTTAIRNGDLLLFYESQTRRAIFARGVVDDVLRSSDSEEILTFIAKRSVYTQEHIQEKASRGGVLAIKFYQSCLPITDIAYQSLESMQILNGPPQSIVQLSDMEYSKLRQLL